MNLTSITSVVLLAGILGLAGCGDEPEPKAQIVDRHVPVNSLDPRYEATLAEGVDFKKPGYPNFLTKASGMSGDESLIGSWGRWTDGDIVTFKFRQTLPQAFALKVRAGAWGANTNQPIKFRIGSIEKEAVFKGDPFNGPSDVTLDFKLSESADTLQIIVPFPVVDKKDARRIGLGLISLKIKSNVN